jgi:anti-anti-sigma factor
MQTTPDRLGIIELGPSMVALSGEIDAQSASALAQRLDALFDGDGPVEIDLAAVSFIDSSGLQVLIVLHQRADDAHRRLVLRSPSRPVVRLLEITGLDCHFHTVD